MWNTITKFVHIHFSCTYGLNENRSPAPKNNNVGAVWQHESGSNITLNSTNMYSLQPNILTLMVMKFNEALYIALLYIYIHIYISRSLSFSFISSHLLCFYLWLCAFPFRTFNLEKMQAFLKGPDGAAPAKKPAPSSAPGTSKKDGHSAKKHIPWVEK